MSLEKKPVPLKQVDGTATGTSTQVLPEDTTGNRRYLLIQNHDTTNKIYVNLDNPHVGTEGIEIAAGGYWEPIRVPNNALWFKSSSGSANYTIFYGK